MKYRILFYLFIIIITPAYTIMAQSKPDNVCYINNSRIYFQLDKRWTDTKKKEISTLFSLDSVLIERALGGNATFIADSITWEANWLNTYIVELSKPVTTNPSSYQPNDVWLLDDNFFNFKPIPGLPIFSEPKKYGVNKFVKEPTIKYENGFAHFYLPGYQKTAQVYLSGSFNSWSTMELPMQKTVNGWEIKVELAPGKYLYKYITDGKWINDPTNLLKEKDGQAGYNSVLYCYNYVFELQGCTDAKKVYVSGSFNGWKKNDLRMNKMPGGWNLTVYLEEGTHAYKFIIDGVWIPDPANSNTRTDSDGNMNSFLGIGDTLVFRLNGYHTAEKVILTGSFNAWSTNELVMNRTNEGWELPYVIAAGNYEYKFIVDGQWMPDPANPVTTGTGNNINSCLVFNPNYTFTLKQFTEAKNVIITGSFNGWSEDNYKMNKKDGVWSCSVYLKPGKYTYKFIVDGNWLIDPANDAWEENEHGTGNSVLWIEP